MIKDRTIHHWIDRLSYWLTTLWSIVSTGRWTLPLQFGLVLIGFAIEVWILISNQYPGDSDAGYYFDAARNLAQGQGLVAKTLWFHGIESDTVTHYAGAHWKPLGPWLAAASMSVVGPSLTAALLPNLVLSVLLAGFAAGFAYAITRDLPEQSGWAAFAAKLAFVLCLFQSWIFANVLSVVPTVLFSVLTTLSLVLAQRRDKATMLMAGVLAGGAAMARNDGLFLLPTLALYLFLEPMTWTKRLELFGVFAAGMLPVVVGERLFALWHGFPSANPLKLLFMTSFEDLYLLPGDLTFEHWMQQSPKQFLIDRLKAGGLNLRKIFEQLGTFPFLLSIVGLATVQRASDRSKSLVLIFFVFLLFDFFANSIILPITGMEGSFRATMTAVFPMALALSAVGLLRCVSTAAGRSAMGLTLALSVAIPTLIDASRSVRTLDPPKIARDRRVGDAITRLANQDGVALKDVIVLGRINDGNFSVVTGLQHVYVPAGREDRIRTVVERYHPQYAALDGSVPNLKDIYEGVRSVPYLSLIGPVDGTEYKLYRIHPKD